VASPQLHTPHGLVEITVDAFVAAPADPTPWALIPSKLTPWALCP